jgi:hypothetical protein
MAACLAAGAVQCTQMSPEVHRRLYELITNPPAGSKIAAAKEFGVDLTLTLRRLTLTPTERAQEMEGALQFMEDLRRAGGQIRP